MTPPHATDLSSRLETMFTGLMSDQRVPARQLTRLNSAAWDSLFQLTLVLAIEQEFDITLTDVEAIDLNSFASALQILEEKLVSR